MLMAAEPIFNDLQLRWHLHSGNKGLLGGTLKSDPRHFKGI